MSLGTKNLLLLLLVVALTVFPLYARQGAEFGGADDQVEKVVSTIKPDYTPWCKPLWKPPSGEIESLLFAVQAAAGSGFVFYYLGYLKGRKSKE